MSDNERQTLFNYLHLTRLENGKVTLDNKCLEELRQKFKELYNDQDIDDDKLRLDTIERLLDDFKIVNDKITIEHVDLIIQQESDKDAETEIIEKFCEDSQLPEPVDFDEIEQSKEVETTTSTTIPTTKMMPTTTVTSPAQKLIDEKVTILDEVICIIHKKSNRQEIDAFIQKFLFQRILSENSPSTSNDPLFDKQIHLLPSNTILHKFIQQRMTDRGMITFTRLQTKFRLVEPISLTDAFDSWTFDHFHGLMDFWFILDFNQQKHFPTQWKINFNTKIYYIINNELNLSNNNNSGNGENQISGHLDRPSTKSLENFLRDICQIEDNGMYHDWFKKLTEKENINTYAHLTNLNQQEWDKIKSLSMNALKTIKFYVNREKQMVEPKKTKKNSNENTRIEENESYSKAELQANLHMIKLYIIRQIEDQDGIPTIPHLDKFCVETAFDEMRKEGYEDDGLFDEMKLFFQPLTVTDDELIINSDEYEKIKEEQNCKKVEYENKIEELKQKQTNQKTSLENLNNQLETLEKECREIYNKYKEEKKKPENEGHRRQNELDRLWTEENKKKRAEIKSVDEQRPKAEEELNQIETEKIEKENLLKIIEQNLAEKNPTIDRRLVKPHRGFIMYGPPGTGKSVIMKKLAKKIGIAMLGPDLAAGELERPLVGQSEAIILDLCMRGNRLPHLMCCLSIDEIDSLAPKRDEDSSEGKVAKISVLLSVIEGIKDVSNLMFFSATNRLHMMDEAFLRRMSGKFFVGRPSSDARKRILQGIPKPILKPKIREKLATATTNFSGAALKSLTSAVTVHYLAQKRFDKNYEIKEEETLILADRTARQFQLFLGLDTLPRLLLHNLDDLQQSSMNEKEKNLGHHVSFHLPEGCRFTGKILISLHDQCVRVEIIQKKNQRHVIEDKLKDHEQSIQQLLERITSYGNDRNVQLLQLIDLNLLSSKGAYDEKKIFETLKERYDECMEYKRSMIIYDLDSLIGVNKSESESSMGTSTSSSVVNQSIYIYVTSRFRESKIEATQSTNRQKIERWAVAVVRDPFLLRKFTADVDFTLTSKQKEQEEEEQRRSTEVLVCVKCRDQYVESENKMGQCNYHDGFVYDNFSLGLEQYKPTEAVELLNQEEFLAYESNDQKEKEAIEKKKARFKYICCYATLQPGGGFNSGCKKGKHGFADSKRTSHRNKQTLDNGTIDQWESTCLDNIEYNEKWAALFETRSNP